MLSLTVEQHQALDSVLDFARLCPTNAECTAALIAVRALLAEWDAGKRSALDAFSHALHVLDRAVPVEGRFFEHSEAAYPVEIEILRAYADKLPAHLRAHPQQLEDFTLSAEMIPQP